MLRNASKTGLYELVGLMLKYANPEEKDFGSKQDVARIKSARYYLAKHVRSCLKFSLT